MVNFCGMVGCSNRTGRDKSKSFYRLPKVVTHLGSDAQALSEERRAIWLTRISRADLTENKQSNMRICSDHFLSGKPSGLYNRRNIDWAPTLCSATASLLHLHTVLRKDTLEAKSGSSKRQWVKTQLRTIPQK